MMNDKPMPVSMPNSSLEGVGIGLRSKHYQHILATKPDIPWFEVLTDNYMGKGGQPLHYLEQVAETYPLSFHCVGMSLGSAEPLNKPYFKKLKGLIERFQPRHISDHLSWGSINGIHGHDLLPMPYTEEAARHIAQKIDAAQDFLGRRILIENVSSYLAFKDSYLTELEFLCDVVQRADCELLCDVNNIYVSARNHDFDAADYLHRLPKERVKELHLAGYEDQGTHLLDTHGSAVHEPVWALYKEAISRFGKIPTLIEWDTDIPEFDVLQQEREKALRYWNAGAFS
jgi:uncharacterized protein (UPF0276 family)